MLESIQDATNKAATGSITSIHYKKLQLTSTFRFDLLEEKLRTQGKSHDIAKEVIYDGSTYIFYY